MTHFTFMTTNLKCIFNTAQESFHISLVHLLFFVTLFSSQTYNITCPILSLNQWPWRWLHWKNLKQKEKNFATPCHDIYLPVCTIYTHCFLPFLGLLFLLPLPLHQIILLSQQTATISPILIKNKQITKLFLTPSTAFLHFLISFVASTASTFWLLEKPYNHLMYCQALP